MKRPLGGFLVALACVVPARGGAQSASHEPVPLEVAWFGHLGDPGLDSFLDSLAATTTHAALRRIDQRWDPRVHRVEKPLGRLRLVFYHVRHGQLEGARGPFDEALSTLEWATRESYDDPRVWYALGLVNLELRRRDYPDRSVVQEHMTSYTSYYLGARRAFRRSLELDSLFRPTLAVLETLVAGEGDRVQPEWLVAAIRRLDALSDDPDIALVLGRQARIDGDYDAARAEFARYLGDGGSTGVARLELARTLAGLDEWDRAVESYWDGLDAAGVEGRRLYRTDLAWVATPEEIEAFDTVAVDSIPEWVAEFWRVRDLEDLRPPGTRLREHLRRWNVVHRHFRVAGVEKRARFNPPLIPHIGRCLTRLLLVDDLDFPNPSRPDDLRSFEPFLDQRAILYMRHGEPLIRSWSAGSSGPLVAEEPLLKDEEDESFREGPDVEGTDGEFDDVGSVETWAYWIRGEFRFFFLRGSDAFGRDRPGLMVAEVPAGPYLHALLTDAADAAAALPAMRRELSKVRHDLMARDAGFERATPGFACQVSSQKAKKWAEESIRTAVVTDGDVLVFDRNLYPTVQVMGMPGRVGSDRGTVLVVFAVPVSRLTLPDSARRVDLRFRISGVEVGSRDGFWVDTTRTFRVAEGVDRSSWLSGVFELPARPADYEVRVAVQLADSTAGNVVELPGSTTPWVPDDSLRLSDAVVGGGGDNLLWAGLGDPVRVNALAAFQPQDTVELYYVQGGLVPGRPYRTDIVLRSVRETQDLLSFSFEETAAVALERKRRGLVLERVRPGVYALVLTLREATSGWEIRRERRITVVEP